MCTLLTFCTLVEDLNYLVSQHPQPLRACLWPPFFKLPSPSCHHFLCKFFIFLRTRQGFNFILLITFAFYVNCTWLLTDGHLEPETYYVKRIILLFRLIGLMLVIPVSSSLQEIHNFALHPPSLLGQSTVISDVKQIYGVITFSFCKATLSLSLKLVWDVGYDVLLWTLDKKLINLCWIQWIVDKIICA